MNEGDVNLHQGISVEALFRRAEHDEIKSVGVRTGVGRKTIHSAFRIVSDYQLWDMLEKQYLDKAALGVKDGYDALAGSQMIKAQDHSKAQGKGVGGGSRGEVIARYIGWSRAVQQSRLDHAQVVDVLVFGKSLRQVDKERRQGKGKARENLVEALKLW